TPTEVQECAAAVRPDGALPLQPPEEATRASAVQPHPELLRERALDLDLPEVAEVGGLLADDLAVEIVLADRARERPRDPDRARAVRAVARHEEALAGEQLALQAAHEAGRHLHLHGDVARDERHRPRLRGQLLARLQRDDDRGRLPLADLRLHRYPVRDAAVAAAASLL